MPSKGRQELSLRERHYFVISLFRDFVITRFRYNVITKHRNNGGKKRAPFWGALYIPNGMIYLTTSFLTILVLSPLMRTK